MEAEAAQAAASADVWLAGVSAVLSALATAIAAWARWLLRRERIDRTGEHRACSVRLAALDRLEEETRAAIAHAEDEIRMLSARVLALEKGSATGDEIRVLHARLDTMQAAISLRLDQIVSLFQGRQA